MFYMQNKGRGKAPKVVNFVAKWLNLCLSTVVFHTHTLEPSTAADTKMRLRNLRKLSISTYVLPASLVSVNHDYHRQGSMARLS